MIVSCQNLFARKDGIACGVYICVVVNRYALCAVLGFILKGNYFKIFVVNGNRSVSVFGIKILSVASEIVGVLRRGKLAFNRGSGGVADVDGIIFTVGVNKCSIADRFYIFDVFDVEGKCVGANSVSSANEHSGFGFVVDYKIAFVSGDKRRVVGLYIAYGRKQHRKSIIG